MTDDQEKLNHQTVVVRVTILEERLRQTVNAVEKLDGKIDKVQESLDDWSEKLSDAIVKGFDRAAERFVPRETWNWWQGMMTKALWGIVVFAAAAFASGWRFGH